MKLVQCPNSYHWTPGDRSFFTLFLGGGISGCDNWQKEMIKLLDPANVIVLNPRRDDFDITDKELAAKQIAWEHKHLRIASVHLFWFPCETLCPITLLELGKNMDAPCLFVGAHPDYKRRFDIVEQLRLERPYDCEVSDSLESLANRVIKFDYRARAL